MSVNEETSDSSSTPGKAVIFSTGLLLITYLVISSATLSYSGTGTTGIGLGNRDNGIYAIDNVAESLFGSVGEHILAAVVIIAVMATIPSTMMPVTRGMLAMSVQGALPKPFRRIHPRYKTPGVQTWLSLVIATIVAVTVSLTSAALFERLATVPGAFYAIYYLLTAVTCARWYYRRTTGPKQMLSHVILPLVGGLVIFAALAYIVYDLILHPDFLVFGIDGYLVFIPALLRAGAAWMLYHRWREPRFFKLKIRPDDPADVHNLHPTV